MIVATGLLVRGYERAQLTNLWLEDARMNADVMRALSDAGVGVMVVLPDGAINRWPSANVSLLGWGPEIIGQSANHLLRGEPAFVDWMATHCAIACQDGRPYTSVVRRAPYSAHRMDGKQIPVMVGLRAGCQAAIVTMSRYVEER